MRCCVTGCKNDSRTVSKSQGITFHVFPVEPTVRSAWLQALGRESWEPNYRSTVCSEHFLGDDLYETKKGQRRKVRAGAVPVILQNSANCEYEDPAALKVCRICLATDSKLIPVKKYKLDQAYNHLTGVSPCEDSRLPQRLCIECAHRLATSHQFRNKCLRSNSLMMEILKMDGDALTLSNIELINREINRLQSPLVTKHLGVDNYHITIDEDNDKNGKVRLFEEDTLETNIKNEDPNNEIFINEFDDDKDSFDDDNDGVTTNKETLQLDKNNEIKNENIDNDIFVNDFEDTKPEDDRMDDDDFIATESSTDDELPRNVLRSRLQERKSKKEKSKVVKKRKSKKEVTKKTAEPKVDRRRKPFFSDDLRETLFTITDLTFEEQVAEIEKRKESANYKNGVYKCEECYKGFLDEDAYNSHMLRHTNESGEYRCHICKTHFKHPHALRKHITAHHTQRFSCKQCVYTSTHRQSARLHERWHKGTKYTCPHCPDEFVKFTTYMGHIRIKHPSDFVCQLCGFSFVSEKGIQLHKRLKHRQEVQIPEDGPYCEPCNLRFVGPEALRRHVSVSARHASLDRGRLPNKPTKGRRTWEDRERDRSGRPRESEDDRKCPQRRPEGPIPCEQCGLQLEDSRAYHGHFRRMHPDKNRTNYPSMKSPCLCEVCGRMFQSFALLKDHRWVHTGERPFSCDSCGKSFRMRQRLVAHRRVHNAAKATYVCTLCGKHLSTHSNRQRHMFIHTGLKPFKCEMCGKGFKHASEKRAHITYVHLKKPWPKRSRGKRRLDPRQVSMQPPPAPGGEALQPIWPCDPKLSHDKPPYYALKM